MICRNAFGDHNSIYADALLDKGFFLLNVDSINTSVEVYMVSHETYKQTSTHLIWILICRKR